MELYTSFQKTGCGKTFTNGSLHRIRQLTITLPVILTTRKQQPGSLKAAFFGNGNRHLLFFGFTGNVRPLPLLTRYPLVTS